MTNQYEDTQYDNTCKMPWGKHKGLIIKFVPTSYLQWIVDNTDHHSNLIEALEIELQRRIDENDHVWDK